MKWIIFLGALLVMGSLPSQPALAGNARGSLSPSAPIHLTYQVKRDVADQSSLIDIAINTRVSNGTLLVEVAKQEGVAAIGETTWRIDLATAARPIALQLRAMALGGDEHYLVLLLTVDTDMGPMSRSFRIELAPAGSGVTL